AEREGADARRPRAADPGTVKLDNPLLVRWEYASEERLTKRNEIFRALIRGTNPEDVAIEALAEVGPKRVLDVGCGTGTLAKRIVEEVGAEVCAVDTSERMVELARALGVDARVADAEQLPYDDRSFDAVFAGWCSTTCRACRRRSPSAHVSSPRRAVSSRRRIARTTSRSSGSSS